MTLRDSSAGIAVNRHAITMACRTKLMTIVGGRAKPPRLAYLSGVFQNSSRARARSHLFVGAELEGGRDRSDTRSVETRLGRDAHCTSRRALRASDRSCTRDWPRSAWATQPALPRTVPFSLLPPRTFLYSYDPRLRLKSPYPLIARVLLSALLNWTRRP